jgi:predicted metal-dependent hydrolase
MTSLALILLGKLYRKKADPSHHASYRAFILRGDIQDRARAARNSRGRAPRETAARGKFVDLNASFDRLNLQYFDGALDKPRISWSMKRSRHILGRYDSTHHMIFVSRLFDTPKIPSYVLDYIMFHEMLHVKHRSRIHDCRVLVHTPEFRSDEKRFSEYKQAKLWVKSL